MPSRRRDAWADAILGESCIVTDVKRQKWVITGGAGFIGCHAASRLHEQGHHVVVVDNLSRRGAEANLAWLREQGITDFIKADVRDPKAMTDAIGRHADADVRPAPRRPGRRHHQRQGPPRRLRDQRPGDLQRPRSRPRRRCRAGRPVQLDEQGLRQPRTCEGRRARRPLRL